MSSGRSPPGGNGTTRFTGLAGQVWARRPGKTGLCPGDGPKHQAPFEPAFCRIGKVPVCLLDRGSLCFERRL